MSIPIMVEDYTEFHWYYDKDNKEIVFNDREIHPYDINDGDVWNMDIDVFDVKLNKKTNETIVQEKGKILHYKFDNDLRQEDYE